jgi:hypothetical protein
MRTSAPSLIDGIEKYLASGMIRGIGPTYARKMVKAFGEKVFDIIEAAMVARSRCPRAFTRSTQKPVSALWNVTRSTMPASTSWSG